MIITNREGYIAYKKDGEYIMDLDSLQTTTVLNEAKVLTKKELNNLDDSLTLLPVIVSVEAQYKVQRQRELRDFVLIDVKYTKKHKELIFRGVWTEDYAVRRTGGYTNKIVICEKFSQSDLERLKIPKWQHGNYQLEEVAEIGVKIEAIQNFINATGLIKNNKFSIVHHIGVPKVQHPDATIYIKRESS